MFLLKQRQYQFQNLKPKCQMILKAAPNLLDELEENLEASEEKTGRIRGHQTTHLTSTR